MRYWRICARCERKTWSVLREVDTPSLEERRYCRAERGGEDEAPRRLCLATTQRADEEKGRMSWSEAPVSLVVAGLGLAGRIGVGCYCSWL